MRTPVTSSHGDLRRLAGAGEEGRDRHAAAVERGVRHRGQLDAGVEHQQRHQGVAGRRGVADVAADGAGIADLVAGEMVAGLDQQRQVLAHQRVLHDLGDGGERADADFLALQRDAGHLRNAADVHQGLAELDAAGLALRHQVGAAREYRHVAEFLELHSTAWSRLVGA
jgi:hypothetical protein